MPQLEALRAGLLRYESFACDVMGLLSASAACGGALFVTQLVCCSLLLMGRFGLKQALFILLTPASDRFVIVTVKENGRQVNEWEEVTVLAKHDGSGFHVARPAQA